MSQTPFLLAIMGPTGSGKSALAERIAEATGAQLVSADAFQIYRGMDIGTNKPKEPERYKLLNIKDPHESYGVGEYVQDAVKVLNELWSNNHSAIVVGGTGLYIRALTERYEDMSSFPPQEIREEVAEWVARYGLEKAKEKILSLDSGAEIDWQNPKRVCRKLEKLQTEKKSFESKLAPFAVMKLGISMEPAVLAHRIEARLDEMLRSGWIEEVQALLERGVSLSDQSMRAIGYFEIAEHLAGRMSSEEVREKIFVRTRQYAKRQRSWMRSEPNLKYVTSSNCTETDFVSVMNLYFR